MYIGKGSREDVFFDGTPRCDCYLSDGTRKREEGGGEVGKDGFTGNSVPPLACAMSIHRDGYTDEHLRCVCGAGSGRPN